MRLVMISTLWINRIIDFCVVSDITKIMQERKKWIGERENGKAEKTER